MNSSSGALVPRIIAVGTANPPTRYSQQEILDLFRCTDPTISKFFHNSHIQTRYLVLPEPSVDGSMPHEDGTMLLEKHRRTSRLISRQAIERCLESGGVAVEEIDFLATVTSTGFLCPSLSAHLCMDLQFRPNLVRADLVGMGCNGGMNGLAVAAQFAQANPGKKALLLACEICSAAYAFELTPVTGVVNSLFGDGAAAVILSADAKYNAAAGPQVMDFESYLLPETIREMRFDFQDGLFRFFLARDVPYVIGEHISKPVQNLLSRHNLHKRDIRHWLVHSGGKKVVDSIKYNLGLTSYDVRHTESILREYGNLSSTSFLFSYQRLTQERIAGEGDYGVTIAMGPGISLETGLLRW